MAPPHSEDHRDASSAVMDHRDAPYNLAAFSLSHAVLLGRINVGET